MQLLSSLVLAALPLLASAAPAVNTLDRKAFARSIEQDLRARGWTDSRVQELEFKTALEASLLRNAAEKRLFGLGDGDSSSTEGSSTFNLSKVTKLTSLVCLRFYLNQVTLLDVLPARQIPPTFELLIRKCRCCHRSPFHCRL